MPRGVWNRPRTPGVPPRRTTTRRNWTREQCELLEQLYGVIPNEQLAGRLGRTVWAMRQKAVKLGILPWKYTTLSNELLRRAVLIELDPRSIEAIRVRCSHRSIVEVPA